MRDEIPLVKVGGVYQLSVGINGVLTLQFILDSGAADVQVPADVVLTLSRTGTIRDSDFLPGKTYVLADGSPLRSARFLLRSLTVGRQHITNVPASIGSLPSTPILGQSFLERLGTWGIDSHRQVLMVGVLSASGGQTPPPPMRTEQQSTMGSTSPTLEGQLQAPSTLRNSIGMEFVLIPAGKFQMGSIDTNADSDEQPVHTVHISRPFYLGRYEVTRAQWETVMGNNPSRGKGYPNLPVESVSWEDIQEFIRQLNAREGVALYRLPTEAEWEYAARAGSTTAYSFGNSANELGYYAWYDGNAGYNIHPVGQLRPNAWGLYDMHGNVWEWVQDWYGPYPSSLVTDPFGPVSGSKRVRRGGGLNNSARACRSADRYYDAPDYRSSNLGFRLLRIIP